MVTTIVLLVRVGNYIPHPANSRFCQYILAYHKGSLEVVGFFREGINHRSWIYAATIDGPFLGCG